MEDLLNAQGVAKFLNCSIRTVWRLVASGDLPQPLRVGRIIRWPREALIDWVDRKIKEGQ